MKDSCVQGGDDSLVSIPYYPCSCIPNPRIPQFDTWSLRQSQKYSHVYAEAALQGKTGGVLPSSEHSRPLAQKASPSPKRVFVDSTSLQISCIASTWTRQRLPATAFPQVQSNRKLSASVTEALVKARLPLSGLKILNIIVSLESYYSLESI